MSELQAVDVGRIAQDLQIRKNHVENVVQLLDEGNTVPFIVRYRKERTGSCDELTVGEIQKRVEQQRQVHERRQTVLKSIETQGKLTDELRTSINDAHTLKRLEDLYLPFKPKKRTAATVARERGLEPFALSIWNNDPALADIEAILPTMVNPEKELPTIEDVRAGARHILAELIAETADVRAAARRVLWSTGRLASVKSERVPEGQGQEYRDYFDYKEPVRQIPAHRILALNRGEREGVLKVKLERHDEKLVEATLEKLPLEGHPHAEFLKTCAQDGLERLLIPSLEREIRRELTEKAQDHAVEVFSRNLRNLLLQPPIQNQRVLAIDPGFRTGCKLAALDEFGNLLEQSVIHPHPSHPKRKKNKAKKDAKAEGTETRTEECKPEESAAPAQNAEAGTDKLAELKDLPADDSKVEASGPEVVEQGASGETNDVEDKPKDAEDSAELKSLGEAEATNEEATTPPTPVHPENKVESGESAPESAKESPQEGPAVNPRRAEAKEKLEQLIRKHSLTAIAIGNGTACRETEEFVAELIEEQLPEATYVIVNEAGASYYSSSPLGREEFPDLDATLRSAISIGRRLQDPLSELVKIDPQNIGVGLYQHDIQDKHLKESLEKVVGSCVNHVGVDVNTASVPLLRHVSGLNQLTARNIVQYRKERGAFRSREQLKTVSNVGEATFVQAAGFLKITGGEEPLDETWIHPESYEVGKRILERLDYTTESLRDAERSKELREKLNDLPTSETCEQLEIGEPTLQDILESLARPGRDPREDLPKPIFRKGILKIEDVQPGMELKGTILNVVDFGAFVDVGLKDSGLIHISRLANRFIKNPHDVVAVGDVVTVWALKVDPERHRVAFTMVKPGSERKPAPRRQRQRQEQENQPPLDIAMPGVPSKRKVEAPPPREKRLPNRAAAQHAKHHRAPPRRPARPKPPPKLSEEALEGNESLRSFAELAAFFQAKKDDPK